MRIVLANGVFDLLHPGHVAHLQEARGMGDLLLVALTMDEYINKHGRPILKFRERAEMLMALRCVSNVTGCENAEEAIRWYRPQVFVKGGDYLQKGLLPSEIEACKMVGAEIRHTAYVPITTTDIVRRIKEAA